MAKIQNCPEPVRRTGGAATPCQPCSVAEDWCYRLPGETADVIHAGKHTYDLDAQCNKTNERWLDEDGAVIDPCTVTRLVCEFSGGGAPSDPLPVQIVCDPVTVPYVDCDGVAQTATGTTCNLIQVVPHPDAVQKVVLCNPADIEKEIFCDPATGNKVAIVTDFSAGASAPVTTYWDLILGAAWTGDPKTLEQCPDTDLESDPRPVCVDGTTSLTQWVVKSDGEPTGTVYYTDAAGAIVPTPTGTITLGECVTCVPTISSVFANDLTGLLPGTTISVQKPSCCAIRVSTSAGDFIVSAAANGYSTSEFDCPVTVTGVSVISGSCALADIVITTQDRG